MDHLKNQLTDKEAMVLRLRKTMSLQEIGNGMGVSRQRVAQIEINATKKLNLQQTQPPTPSELPTSEPQPPADDWPSDDDFEDTGDDE